MLGLEEREWNIMPARLDLIGERFGRLVVSDYVGNSLWLCVCDCGNSVNVKTNKLRSGNTKSCKCYRNTLLAKERTLGSGYANFKEVLRHYIKEAKRRGYVFELSEESCHKIMKMDCYYCGIEPSQIYKHGDCFGDFVYNGMDRYDNTLGYIEGNVVPCCKDCNYAKRAMSVQEFENWIQRVHKRMQYWKDKYERSIG